MYLSRMTTSHPESCPGPIHDYLESELDKFLEHTARPHKYELNSADPGQVIVAGKCKACPDELTMRVAIAAYQAAS